MKKTIVLLTAFATLVFSSSCKKDDDEIIENPFDIEEEGSNDETARSEYDESIDDVFTALKGTALETARLSSNGGNGLILPCGVFKIDSSSTGYTLRYDGSSNCGGRVLSGDIEVEVSPAGAKWTTAGTQITIKYDDYTIQFNANNEILVFNGSLTVTNTSGGLLGTLFQTNPITHVIRGTLKVTFDNGAERNWRITKKRTWDIDGTDWATLTLEISADSVGIAEKGINRAGDSFETTIPTNFLFENCHPTGGFEGPYILTQGKMIHSTQTASLEIEAGYKLQGTTSVTKVGDCDSQGFKLTLITSAGTASSFQYY